MARIDFQARPVSRAGAQLSNRTAHVGTTIAGSGTTVINLGGSPSRAYLTAAIISNITSLTSGSAATAVLRKRTAPSTYVTLTAAVDLVALVAEQPAAFVFLSTAAVDLARTVQGIETLQLLVTTAGTVTAQPVGMVVTLEEAILS